MTDQSDKRMQNDNERRQNAPPAGSEARRRKTAAARLSIASNTALVLLKLGVGFATGSVSVLSEAIHSASDLLAAGIAFFSVRASDTPPDAEHPYGHGKMEALSGLAESALIFAAAGYIIVEAVQRLIRPAAHPPQVAAGIAVMGCSALLNFCLSRYLHRVAQETDSLALEADAEHLRTDVLTSVGVLAGLALVHVTGLAGFDSVSALLVALLILYAAWRLSRNALRLLMDARLPAGEEAAIQEVLETEPRVLGYHKLRTRKSGSQRHVDVHVQMDDDCTLVEAHELAEELEDRIRAVLPEIHVNIHIEPYRAELRHQHEAHGAPPPPDTGNRHGGMSRRDRGSQGGGVGKGPAPTHAVDPGATGNGQLEEPNPQPDTPGAARRVEEPPAPNPYRKTRAR
jgi:cation diffusion facilitator family transporter